MFSRSKTWAAALLLATFVAGAAVGAGARTMWARRAARHGPDHFLGVLTQELRLTPLQHDSVGAVIWRHWHRTNALWDSLKPRFDSVRANMDSEVVRLLTPDQATKYRDHVTRHRHQREQERQENGRRP